MKLILAILSNDDSPVASNALNKNGFSVTKLATTGGFLRAGNTTLIIGCEDEKVEAAIDIIKEYSSKRTEIVPSTASYDIGRYASFPVEVTVGGATIFVLDVAQFLKVQKTRGGQNIMFYLFSVKKIVNKDPLGAFFCYD